MAATSDDRRVGLGLVFGLLAAGAAGYTLAASLQAATATEHAATLQTEAAVGFAASIVFGTLVIAAIHLY